MRDRRQLHSLKGTHHPRIRKRNQAILMAEKENRCLRKCAGGIKGTFQLPTRFRLSSAGVLHPFKDGAAAVIMEDVNRRLFARRLKVALAERCFVPPRVVFFKASCLQAEVGKAVIAGAEMLSRLSL